MCKAVFILALALAFMTFGVLISSAYFKLSDFDKRYYYYDERVKRTTMCI